MSRLCVFIILASLNCSYVIAENVSCRAYKKYHITPEVLSDVPAQYLHVQYPSGAIVREGNVLTPTQVKDIPCIKWEASKDKLYIVAMVDPDFSTSPELTHWLVGNIPGDDIESGETIVEYIGSGPPQGEGLHRYVFAVYEQPCEQTMTFDEPRVTNRMTEERKLYTVTDFARKYRLGDPVAGNFFRAKYDDYVPILYKQLGID